MPDVFVEAVQILNMKFDSIIIVFRLGSGTTIFTISVVLLMLSSGIAGKMIAQLPEKKK